MVYLKVTCLWNVNSVDTRVTMRISSRHSPGFQSQRNGNHRLAVHANTYGIFRPGVNVFKRIWSNQYIPVRGFKDLIRRLWQPMSFTGIRHIDHVRNSCARTGSHAIPHFNDSFNASSMLHHSWALIKYPGWLLLPEKYNGSWVFRPDDTACHQPRPPTGPQRPSTGTKAGMSGTSRMLRSHLLTWRLL